MEQQPTTTTLICYIIFGRISYFKLCSFRIVNGQFLEIFYTISDNDTIPRRETIDFNACDTLVQFQVYNWTGEYKQKRKVLVSCYDLCGNTFASVDFLNKTKLLKISPEVIKYVTV